MPQKGAAFEEAAMTVFGLTATSHLVPPLSGRVAGCPALGHGLIWAHAGRFDDTSPTRSSTPVKFARTGRRIGP